MKIQRMPFYLKTLFLLTVSLLTASVVSGQTFGNEWIDQNQTYYKFKVAEDGIYRITAAQLQAAGFPVSSVPANRIRLYRKGEEQAIRVNSAGGLLESFDFYGRRNDGSQDTDLYSTPSNQLHPGYSLFSDSSAYFITYSLNNTSGLRMGSYTEANSQNIAADNYYTRKQEVFFNDQYSAGRRYSGGDIILSSYDRAEGWIANPVKTGENRDIIFNLSDGARDFSGPSLLFHLVGSNNNQHNAVIYVGPDESNLRELSNFIFTGYDFRVVPIDISWDDVGIDGSLMVRVVPSASNDRISLSTMTVDYPALFQVGEAQVNSLTLNANVSDKSFLRVSGAGSESELFDVTDAASPVIIGVNRSADGFTAIVRNTVTERELLISESKKSVTDINAVNMPAVDPGVYNYLIVTHRKLREGGDQVGRYADYRSSESGGLFSVLISDIDDLYNVFNYGDPSPLAIRKFAGYMLNGGDPEYLFIIGKGVTPASGYYRLQDTDIINYVPAYGHPGSDVPFTSGLVNDGYEAGIPTGRISAFSPEEVAAYLDKVIEMEATPFNDFWRKRSLLLSGGQTTGEQNQFRSYIEDFEDVLSGTFLGGTSSLFSKQDSKAVTFINVTDEINQGVSLVTFFGHSSASTSDIEVGLVSNPEVGYTNKGRYPIFLINGCNAGNFYSNETLESTRIFGDDWILTPDLGAVGFIASSSFALSRNLKNFSDLFLEYGYSTEDFFGRGVGDILQRTGGEYIKRFSSSQTNISQVQQFSLNGDPAVKLYGADKADYEIRAEDVRFEPIGEDLITATSDSFNITMSLKNYGRLVKDPVEVTVLRELSDGTVINYDPVMFNPVRSQDTLSFTIRRNPEMDETGTSIFEILVDPLNKTEEINESNNSVVLTLDIFSGSTSNLYPLNYGIVSGTDVILTYQLSDLVSEDKSVMVEIDTAAGFDSPWKRERQHTAGILNEWDINIGFPEIADGQVFYWRTRLTDPGPTENGEWVTSSFSYISGSSAGWRQATGAQLQNSSRDGASVTTDGTWEFDAQSTPVQIETFGSGNGTLTKDDVRVLIEGSNILIQNIEPTPRFPDCADNTFNAIVFDRRSALPYTPIFITGDESKQRLVCGRRPQLVYNFLEKDITGLDEADQPVNTFLDSLINQSALGDVVLLFNIGEVAYSKWPAEAITKLEEIGVASASIASLEDGQPLIVIGKKGAAPGTAIIVSDNGSADPLTEQALQLVTDITGSQGEGKVKSLRVGPASGWGSFSQQVDVLNEEDEYSTTIYGVVNGNRDILVEGFTGAQLDLSGTAAQNYAHLEFEWSFADQARQTPAQLREWQVTFDPLPDGLLIDQNNETIVQEGVVFTPQFGFLNYTDNDFADSLSVSYSIFNRTNRNFYIDTLKIKAPLPGDTTFFTPAFPTVDFLGENDVSVRVNADNLPEQYYNNNLVNRSALLIVEPDRINPVLDVTFDGRYIKNGAFVSPDPTIVVRLKDENEFFVKSDTTGILLFMKMPGEGSVYEQIYFSDAGISWTPASDTEDFSLIYKPGELEGGFYGLRVQAEDASGNSSGSAPYEINFTVEKEASISGVTPFPNPFRDGVRFAFTLTGSEPPEAFNIDIYSMRGQLMRTITIEELGDLHIGENVTETIWDGSDSQGRNLPNGIYFYKIRLIRNGEQIDGSFIENGIGRLYLLR